MTKLSVVIVGAGIIGRNHAAAMLRHPGLAIVALVDPIAAANAELAAWITEQTGSSGASGPAQYATLATALAHGDLDIAVICTPSGTHADLTAEALAAGLHVVIEKPLDSSLEAGRRLARLADEAATKGQVVSVICQHRFDPASVAVAQAVNDGAFGRITSAVASVPWWRGQDYYDSAGWRGTWAQDGGGATMNQGVHTVDLLLWLLGRPIEVSAQTATLAHERIEVEDVAVATLRFASGALAVVHATTAAYPGMAVRLAVHGDRGSAVIHDDKLEYFHIAGGVGDGNQAASVVDAADVSGAPSAADSFIAGHWRQYVDIVEAIDTGRPPAISVADALLALAVVKSMYLSATSGRTVAIDAMLSGDLNGETS